jgi:hypothetical protein
MQQNTWNGTSAFFRDSKICTGVGRNVTHIKRKTDTLRYSLTGSRGVFLHVRVPFPISPATSVKKSSVLQRSVHISQTRSLRVCASHWH